MPHALIVSHGQPSDPAPAEEALRELAVRIAEHLPDWRVSSATMADGTRLEDTARTLPAGCLVYPMFMAEGWFVKTKLRKRLDGLDLRFAKPFGAEPELPHHAAEILRAASRAQGWPLPLTQILIPAHGSARSDLAAQATRSFARALKAHVPGSSIHVGFVEQDPSIEDAARDLTDHAISLPFFAAGGGHVVDDVPEGLDAGGFTGLRLPPIGLDAGVPSLIARSLRRYAEALV